MFTRLTEGRNDHNLADRRTIVGHFSNDRWLFLNDRRLCWTILGEFWKIVGHPETSLNHFGRSSAIFESRSVAFERSMVISERFLAILNDRHPWFERSIILDWWFLDYYRLFLTNRRPNSAIPAIFERSVAVFKNHPLSATFNRTGHFRPNPFNPDFLTYQYFRHGYLAHL